MTKNKFSIVCVSVFLLIALSFSMVSCADMSKPDDEATEMVETDALATSFENNERISLKKSSPMMMSRATGVITHEITATVTPATATNKKVDWSVAWGDDSKTEDVSDYITVTPKSDGSNVATVTCKGAFSGNIIISATTRQNGYKADCIATFVGIPANIEIESNLTELSDGYHVNVGSVYTFNTHLSNPFGEVGNAYKNLSVTVEGVGTIKVASKEVYKSGGEMWYDSLATNIDINSIASKFIEASIDANGVISVNCKKAIEDYYNYMDTIDSGRTNYYNNCFRDYVTNCYFKIILTEPKSGVSTSFNIVFDANAVNGVDVGNEMYF